MNCGSTRVTVVTPVYNGGHFLAECIESVLAQTYQRFEYVISDNFSTDATKSVIERYAGMDERIRLVRPHRFLPQAAHWNFAASQAAPAAAYLKFVHADDTLEPSCLQRMVALADAHPSVGIVGALRRYGSDEIDLDGVPPTVEVVPGRWLIRQQLQGGRYTTGTPTSTLLRTDLLPPRATLYDVSYVHTDDALSYRLLLDSDFGFVAEPLTYTRRHPDSTTTWCERVGTWVPEHLRMSLQFGSHVLTVRELDRVVTRWERDYARALVKSTITLKFFRDRAALRFHRIALGQIEQAARQSGRRMSRTLRAYATVLRDSTGDGSPPGL